MRQYFLLSVLFCCAVTIAVQETAIVTLSFDTTDNSNVNSASVESKLDYDTRDYELLIDSERGLPVPEVGSHTYVWRSTITCSVERVVQDGGSHYLCNGWAVEPGMSGSGNEIVLKLNSVETQLSWLWSLVAPGDSDGDGFDDIWEASNALVPGVDDSGITSYIQNNPSTFDLYSSNAVLDLNVGDIGMQVIGGNANLSLQLEQSDDLQGWTNVGDRVQWSLPVSDGKKFFRVRANP